MTGVDPAAFAPVAVTTRSGFRESVHFGAGVALAADGSIAAAVGDPDVVIFPRSANKPVQAQAMLDLGWEPTPEQLALACASHAGTPAHTAVVESILATVGLTVDALANTPALPLDDAAAHAAIRAGGPTSLLQNCSGKHAAMLATCVVNGWSTADYLDDAHPLQAAISAAYASWTEQGDVSVGVDGCGAPTHATPLVRLARAYAALARVGGPVHAAMTGHPELVDGAGRKATRLMQAVPGLMVKPGAEGVLAAAAPDGRAVAVKIADGASRAVVFVAAFLLTSLGFDVDPADFGDPILGHGQPVGRLEPLI